MVFGGLSPARPASVPQHPAHNLKPNPDYLPACVEQGPNSHRCISQSVAAIENARARESMRRHRLVLPRNYASLTAPEQEFVVIDLERVDRGIRPIRGLVSTLNTAAGGSAHAELDPHPATLLLQRLGVHRYRSVWADDYGALSADYEWMYDDGYSGANTTNAGCRYPGAPGCWSHRVSILYPFTGLPLLLAGTGAGKVAGGGDSVTAILTGGHGAAPKFTYTWKEARAHGADGHRRG